MSKRQELVDELVNAVMFDLGTAIRPVIQASVEAHYQKLVSLRVVTDSAPVVHTLDHILATYERDDDTAFCSCGFEGLIEAVAEHLQESE